MQRVPMNKIQTGILLVLLFFGLSTFAKTPGKSGIRRTGTFSTFEYNKEGGDVLGVEIRIVRTRTGYQAVVQFAEGEPGDLIVAPVTFEGQKVRLVIKPFLIRSQSVWACYDSVSPASADAWEGRQSMAHSGLEQVWGGRCLNLDQGPISEQAFGRALVVELASAE